MDSGDLPDDLNQAQREYYAACDLMDAGDWPSAITLLERSGEASPHFKTFERLGECLLQLGRDADALPHLARAIEMNEGPRAAILAAEVCLRLGESPRAEEFAQLALARAPHSRRAKEALRKVREGNFPS